MKENVIIGQVGTLAQTNKIFLGGEGNPLHYQCRILRQQTAVKTVYGKQWHNGKVDKH